MTVSNDDLLMSILSMDVYNRSSNQGVFVPGNDDLGTSLAGATVILVSSKPDNVDHSFHAIAYRLADGRVVIDYRGTDDTNANSLDLFAANDITNGWTVGGGYVGDNQSGLAIQFYQDVLNITGHSDLTPFDQAPSNFMFTGHSLGGGLAGMVASLSHGTAIVTDNMPYGIAAIVEYLGEVMRQITLSPTASAFLGVVGSTTEERMASIVARIPLSTPGALAAAISAVNTEGHMPPVPDWSNVSAYHVDGEVLQGLREGTYGLDLVGAGAVLAAGGFLTLNPVVVMLGTAVATLGGVYATAFAALNLTMDDTELSVYGWHDADMVHRHSAALEVLLSYADNKEAENGLFEFWHGKTETVDAVLDGLFNDDIGKQIGLTVQPKNSDGTAPAANLQYTGFVNEADQMARMIAYSTITSGNLVFGNTAAEALFNDAIDLGRALEQSNSLTAGAGALGQIIAQFAGQLAYGQITKAGYPGAAEGVLSLDSNAELLTVDFSDTLWNLKKAGSNLNNDILGRDSFVASYIGDIDDYGSDFREEMQWLWGTSNSNVIDRFAISLNDEGLDVTLPDRAVGSNTSGKASVTLTVGTDFTDSIRGSSDDDFIIGGDGDDTLTGSLGNDLLVGGDGDDTFISFGHNTVFDGGSGTDTANYSLGSGVTMEVGRGEVEAWRTGSSYEDHLYNVEKVRLSEASDNVQVTGWTSLQIDGGGQSSQPGDLIDFSGAGGPVIFQNGGRASAAVDVLGVSIPSPSDQIQYSNFEYVVGTSGDDVYSDGSTVNMRVDLGGGADTVVSAAKGTIIDLGANDGAKDVVHFNGDTLITDFGKEDRVTLLGMTLYGGLRNGYSDNPYAVGLGGLVKYGLTKTGDLLISFAGFGSMTSDNTMTIAGWGNSYNALGIPYLGNGNITLAEFKISAVRIIDDWTGKGSIWGTWELFGLMTKVLTGTNAWGGIDPLVLDLNGDGFNLGIMSSVSPLFDTDADLYKENTGWVGREDGFLVRDIGNDGRIEDARELFGGGTEGGFAVLATLDGNHDGVVNAADNGLADFDGNGVVNSSDTFDDLKVWQDLNQNGQADTGELKSVADYNIVSFSLNSTPVNETINSNLVSSVSTFTRSDGSTGAVGDAVLKLDNENTVYQGPEITISAEAAAEPDLKGYGTLVSLRQALSVEPSDIALVDQTMNGLDIDVRDMDSLRAAIRPLLAAWVDGSPIRASNGSIVHGSDAVAHYEDMPVIRLNGSVNDYAYDIQKITTATDPNGQPQTQEIWTFVSGLVLTLKTPDGQTPTSLADLHTLSGSVTISSGTEVVNGVTRTVKIYSYANGEELKAVLPSSIDATTHIGADTFNTIVSGANTVSNLGAFTLDTVLGSEVTFFERYLGEILPFHNKPSNAAAAVNALQTAVDNMDQNLNLIAVRVLVQSSAFASIFSDLTYDSTSDTFKAASDRQLTPTFANLLAAADTQANPETWLQSWAPILDIIIGDFDRGNELLNTNGFLAQNIVAAFEETQPSFNLMTALDGLGLDSSLFVTGSGTMTGTGDADIFYLDGSNQTAMGGGGVDNYIVGSNFGHDIIDDEEDPMAAAEDIVRFTDLNPDDVTLTMDGEDLIVTVNATGDTLKIVGQSAGEWPGAGSDNLWVDKGVAVMAFADGTTWDEIDIARTASHSDAASTTVVGTADNNVLDGGAGDDVLQGQGDGDIYVFGLGYGHDTIQDLEDNFNRPAFDVLSFGTGITSDNLTFHRDGSSDDVLITINGNTSDTLKIEGQFAATYTGVFGTLFSRQIEVLAFANGEMMSADEIDQKLIDSEQTAGNDTIYGFSREDTLRGGKGDDFLSGGNENDRYVFGKGDGHDTIEEGANNILGGMTDTLYFENGISASDVVFSRDGDDLMATIASTGDSVRIAGQYAFLETGPFGTQNFNLVENFAWSDGTTKDWYSVMVDIVHASETAGDDHVVGTHFNDIIDGKAGDDLLENSDGDDTYIFASGDGHDTIKDTTNNILAGGDNDTISFQTGISSSDIQIERTGSGLNDAILTFANSGDSITIEGQFVYTTINFRPYEIEHFTFSDGTSWTTADLRHAYLQQHETSGNDVVEGFYTNDLINGGGGNDVLRGGDNNDTYVFDLGFGRDRIEEHVNNAAYSDDDQITFTTGLNSTDAILSRVGNDLIIGFNNMADQVTIADQFTPFAYFGGWSDIENVTFADGVTWTDADIRTMLIAQSETSGNDTITGYFTADDFDGGAGDDLLVGKGGGDTYHFGIGSGHDTIDATVDTVYQDSPDTILFKTGLTASDLAFTRSANDLVISILGTSDTLRIENQFGSQYDQVETFAFADGTSLTKVQVAALAVVSQATSGADTILGTVGADYIDGGAGNDILKGDDGADTYHFSSGFGQDTIQETVGNIMRSDDDSIVFDEGIDPDDIVLSRNGNDLILSVANTQDKITVVGQFGHAAYFDGWNDIEHVKFADGTEWSDNDIRLRLIAQSETSGNDVVQGFYTNDTFDAGAGNDTIYGYGGGDLYKFDAGDGADVIYEQVSTVYEDEPDTLQFGAGIDPLETIFTKSSNDLIITFNGSTDQVTVKDFFHISYSQIELFKFANGAIYDVATVSALANRATATSGNDTLSGTMLADTFQGLAGNDSLTGLAGSDVYIYGIGDGNDTIYEGTGASDTDALSLGAGISSADLIISRSGFTGAVLTFAGHSGAITLDNEFKAGGYGIEEIRLHDGSILSLADIRAAYLSHAETAGNDTFFGFDGVADTLAGGTGNDAISGGTGSDTYVYNVGDGADTITEAANVGDTDKLVLGSGLIASGMSVTRSGTTMVLTFAAQSASLTLQNQFALTPGSGIEQVQFGNGAVWSATDLFLAYALPNTTSGNDTVSGTSATDFIAGGLGNDTLTGSGGSDVYLYRSGDGTDTINEVATYNSDTDVLMISGYTSGQASFTRLTNSSGNMTNNVRITFDGSSTDAINIGNIEESSGSGLEQVRFGDKTYTAADIRALLVAQSETTGNDTIVGFNGAETFQGGTGSDSIAGGNGSDTYLYSAGDGADTISEAATYNSDVDTLAVSGYTSDQAVFTRLTDSSGKLTNNVRLSFEGSPTDSINIGTVEESSGSGLEQIQFADRTYTRGDLRALLIAQTETSGDDTIVGFNEAETFQGGIGSDSIAGGNGSDTYLYSAGDGTDTISEAATYNSDVDTLVISGYTSDQAVFTRLTDSSGKLTNNVRLSFEGSPTDSVNIGTVEESSGSGLEQIQFADRTYTRSDLRALLIAQTETNGDDTIVGFNEAETFQGGTGTDRITGGSGSDTYLYSAGDGADTVVESATYNSDVDTLIISGYTSDQAVFTRLTDSAGNLTANVRVSLGGADSVSIGTVEESSGSGLEQVQFADRNYGRADIRTLLIAQSETSGNDTIVGFNEAETFQGGTGNDRITGGSGSDTYLFSTGDGADTIVESATYNSDVDTLIISGYTSSQVQFIRLADAAGNLTNNVRLVFNNSADQIDIGTIYGTSGEGVEKIQFSDHTYSLADLQSLVWTYGSANADRLTGSATANMMSGLDGNDVISGGNGDDTLVGGGGNDNIDGGAGFDEADFSGASTDYTFARNANGSVTVTDNVGTDGVDILTNVESVYFQGNHIGSLVEDMAGQYGTSNSDASILGTDHADNLYGLGGDDTLTGNGGDDLIDGGAGADEADFNGNASDYTFRRAADGSILVTDNVGGDGTDRLVNIEYVYFGGDHVGKEIAQVVSGYGTAGDDALIAGTAGDDNLYGLAGNDLLYGKTGNDILNGGDGEDQVNFLGGITDYTLTRQADGTILVNGPSGQTVTLIQVEDVYFEGSGNWRSLDQLVGDYGTPGDDPWISGAAGNDHLYGLAGDDTLIGQEGNDFIDGGAGEDQVNYNGDLADFTFTRRPTAAWWLLIPQAPKAWTPW